VKTVTAVMSPEVHDKRLHMHEITTKEIKRKNAASNRDDDLTYAIRHHPKPAVNPMNMNVMTLVLETKQVHETAM